nr:hypothetical protein [Nonomuraea phyllanthi]
MLIVIGWSLSTALMRRMRVVVIEILVQDHAQMTFAVDQHSVGALAAYRPDPALGVAVRPWCPRRRFSLEEIHEMMATSDAAERRTALLRRREELARHIAEAQASLDLIDCALDCDHEDLAGCPHFQSMIAERISPSPPPHDRVNKVLMRSEPLEPRPTRPSPDQKRKRS